MLKSKSGVLEKSFRCCVNDRRDLGFDHPPDPGRVVDFCRSGIARREYLA